ncbi:MAG: TonB-dependent receptor [Bryobacterales bacterium]|nr:TonB-dependent receptor [Bryobacterales bacterium]
MRTLIACVLSLYIIAGQALGQESRGSIVGRVLDSSGAVIPGATVTATNQNTNVAVNAQTNDQGNYQILFLIPGVYKVTAALPGFKTFVKENIELRVNDRIGLDMRLEVGDVTENVVVSAEAPLLQTATADVGLVVDNRRISELPLAHGNASSLIMLTPGVNMSYPAGMKWQDPMRVAQTTMMSVQGAPFGSTEFTMDGVPNTQSSNADRGQGISNQPPADAIQEFKVETSFDASVGHTSGTLINTVIKSGTNDLHGTAYYFLRDPALNANGFFSNAAGQPKGDFTYKRWGGSLGGPVYLPKLYNGKDRTFFMYTYEGLHQNDTNAFTGNVPKEQWLTGDLSDLLLIDSRYQIYDPDTIAPAPNGRFSRQPFPGNRIPASRISPIALNIAKFWPKANVAGLPDGTNNFSIQNRSEPIKYFNHIFRGDHVLTQSHRLFGRYAGRNALFGPYRHRFGNEGSGNHFLGNPKNIVIDDVWTASPQLVINFRYGLQRFPGAHYLPSEGFDLTSLGFSKSLVDMLSFRHPMSVVFPTIVPQGIQALQTEGTDLRAQDIHSWFADVNRPIGNHNVKFGADVRVYRENVYAFGSATPRFDFRTDFTRGPLDNSPSSPSGIGQGMAAFLLGRPTGGGVDWMDSRAVQSTYYAAYFQDNWRATPKLTLSLGLRYEYEGPVTERFNRSTRAFDSGAPQAIASQVEANYRNAPLPERPVSEFRVAGGLTFAGAGGQPRTLYKPDKNNFMPRFGFSYNVLKDTVVRGGYAIYFISTGQPARRDPYQLGYSLRTNLIPTLDNGLTFVADLANPFPGGIQRPRGNADGAATFLGRGINFFDVDSVSPYNQRWNFNIQRLLPAKFLIEIGYMGSRVTKLIVGKNLDVLPSSFLSRLPERDQPVIDRLSAQVPNPFYPLLPGTDLAGRTLSVSRLLLPYPQFSSMSTTTNQGYSWYHGMQMRAERRFSQGYTLQLSYTWSKLMDATTFLNADDPMPYETISDSDKPHNISVSGIYEIPFGKGRRFLAGSPAPVRALVGGWQVSAVYQMYSGEPLGFGDVIFRGNIEDIPLPGKQTVNRWFNTDAGFERSSARQLSHHYRTFPIRFSGLRADNYNTWDISLLKNTEITEKVKFQFRAEFLNAFNHPTFLAPNTSVTSTAFGKVTGEATWPRFIQFGFKTIF